MGRVIFMCGPAGSGKSTVARQYERQGMTRLSFEQEAWSRGTTMPLPPAVHREIEDALRARLVDLVRAGADVVLDFSFWSRAMREEYRALLRPLGVVPETVYLATDRATVLKRVSARAELLPNVAVHHRHWRESYFYELHDPSGDGDAVFFTMAHYPAQERVDSLQMGRVGGRPLLGVKGRPYDGNPIPRWFPALGSTS